MKSIEIYFEDLTEAKQADILYALEKYGVTSSERIDSETPIATIYVDADFMHSASPLLKIAL